MGTLLKLCLLLLTVFSRYATSSPSTNPNNIESVCSSTCTTEIAGSGLMFTNNVEYTYEFNGMTIINPPTGNNENNSELKIKGTVKVAGIQNCGAIVDLLNVEITQGSETTQYTELKEHPVIISYNNGIVSPKMCTAAEDSIASINLKRAIVSAFQVSSIMDEENYLFETDIQGTCNTSYSTTATSLSDSHYTIMKYKNLAQCSGHDKINLFSSSESNQGYGTSPFSEAIQNSEIQIIGSRIESVTNKETLTYQPLGSMDLPTKIINTMYLKLKKRIIIHTPSLDLNRERYIAFEKPVSVIGSANTESLVSAVQLAMANIEPEVTMDGAKYITDLIALLKVANKNDILSAYNQIKKSAEFDNNNANADIAKEIFVNALITANSGKSIEAIVELIKNNELSDSLVNSWFNNMANAKHPTKEAVVSASSLLNYDGVSKESYTGFGVLLNKYIQNTNDYKSPEVETALNNLGAPLKKHLDSSLSVEDQDLAIASLRGLRNVLYINSDMEDAIIQIIKNKDTNQRIRALALSMIRDYAKNQNINDACKTIFMDWSEDSELRLLAFKVYAMNPSNKKANVIKNILNNKKCHLQVRAYLLSYLNNLQTTIDETKFDQKKFYEGIYKPISSKKSLTDILRYSQSLEYSYTYPIINSGGVLDGEIIYSYDSFVARYSSVSLNANIFGSQQNIFDFEIRLQNIEYMLEKLFGPEGYFNKNNVHAYNDIKNYIIQALNYAKNKKLNNVDSGLSTEKDYDNSLNGDIYNNMYIDLGLKLLGNDLGSFAFHGLENQVTSQNLIDAIFKHFNNVMPADNKNIEVNIAKQLPIIDHEKKYATCSGLPISIQFQATAAIKFNIVTKIDLENYINHPENSHFALKVIPSGSLILNTFLTVDGYGVEVGHKISSSLHTSTGSDVNLQTVQGHGFEISFGVPVKDMDVFSMQNRAFKIVNKRGNPSSEIPLMTTSVERKSFTRTFDELVNKTGLEYYVNIDIPWNGHLNSLHPLLGPSIISFKILKKDEQLTKYVINGTYDLYSPELKYLKIVTITPNTDIDRNVEMYIAYESRKNNTLLAEFTTPYRKIVLRNTLINTDSQKTIDVHYLDDNHIIFSLGAICEKVDNEITNYWPVFNVTYIDKTSTENDGHILKPIIDIEGYVQVKYNEDSQCVYPSSMTLKDIVVVTPNINYTLQGLAAVNIIEIIEESSMGSDLMTVNTRGKYHSVYKADGNLKMIRSEPNSEKDGRHQLVLDDKNDEYKPVSKLFKFLNEINTVELTTSQELYVESPYKFTSNNRISWNNDYLETNGDFQIQNKKLTMNGDISTSNLLDLALHANITIMPNTEHSIPCISGNYDYHFNSEPSNTGVGHLKYSEDKIKPGGFYELILKHPETFGVFNLTSTYHLTDEKFEYTLMYDVQNSKTLTVDLVAMSNDVNFNLTFDYLKNPYYKSHMTLHGWSNKENSYSLNTKILWPGQQNLNYLNVDGNFTLNSNENIIEGNIDCPLVNLRNVHMLIKHEPSSDVSNTNVATIRCVSNDQHILLFEKLQYKVLNNDDIFLVTGNSVHDDNENNVIPFSFLIRLKNNVDLQKKSGKEFEYRIGIVHDGHKYVYKRYLKFINNTIVYRQKHSINNKHQTVSMNLEYELQNLYNWSYDLKFNVVSPDIFHYLISDNHNKLEFNSYAKLNSTTFDEEHSLDISTPTALVNSYTFRKCITGEKIRIKLRSGEREIKFLGNYKLTSINGGYSGNFSGSLWLDAKRNSTSKSTFSLDSYYSIGDRYNALSANTNLKYYMPVFKNKEMGVNADIQLFKNWENLMNLKLNLDVFPTVEQALEICTNFSRNNQINGILYSMEILAKSNEMELDYLIKDSLLISNNTLGKFLDTSFIDSYNIERPLQLHVETVPRGLKYKINVFDTMMIDVYSTINIKDGVNARSIITYNGYPYFIDLVFTSYPSVNFIFGWKNNNGNLEQLKMEFSLTLNDSAVVDITYIKNNGQDVISVGSVGKSLDVNNWWHTNNQINGNQWNYVWNILRTQFIKRSIEINGNIKKIKSVVNTERSVRLREARKIKSQYNLYNDHLLDEYYTILREYKNDNYLPEMPNLILNTTEVLLGGGIDYLKYIDSYKQLRENLAVYMRNNNYLEDIKLYLYTFNDDYEKIKNEAKLTAIDLNNIIKRSIFINDMSSSEPHSLKEYFNDIINKVIHMIKELKDTIENLQDVSEDYINKSPIYNIIHEEIEQLKSYPYKDKLLEKINKYMQELQDTAPTNELASFLGVLNKYINNVICNKPVDSKDIIELRNKSIIVMKSFMFDFARYVDYHRAMQAYNALNALTKFSKSLLYIFSSSSFQSNHGPITYLYSINYMNSEQFNPSNLLPPFNGQGLIINSNNIITYNNQAYSIKPNTGCYTLSQDLVNDKFSIVANYINNDLSSILVSINSYSTTYELMPGGNIVVNGEDVDFSFNNNDVNIWSDDYYFGIDSGVGISIKCTKELDIVNVIINGYYYNRVYGLLGSMNYEPLFDFKQPNGKNSINMESFVSAYRKSGDIAPAFVNSVQIDQSPCPSMFSELSFLNDIFQTVPPQPYKKICNEIISSVTSEEDRQNKVCLVAKAYVNMARDNFMLDSKIPDACNIIV